MKPKLFRMLTASALSLALVVSSASTMVFAAGETYYLGDTAMTVQENDMFGLAFKGLMPGDEKSTTVSLVNHSGFAQNVSLMAEAQTEEAQTLIDLVQMKVRLNGALLYWGNVAGDAVIAESDAAYDDMHDWMSLGRFNNGASAPLEIELIVPETLGNDFQSIMDQVVWRLHTERINTYVDGGDDDGDDGDEFILTPATLTEIPETPTPLADLPKTGGSLEIG